MLLGQVALTVGAGLVLGLPATWALTRIIESQLYGIKPHDPVSLLIASDLRGLRFYRGRKPDDLRQEKVGVDYSQLSFTRGHLSVDPFAHFTVNSVKACG